MKQQLQDTVFVRPHEPWWKQCYRPHRKWTHHGFPKAPLTQWIKSQPVPPLTGNGATPQATWNRWTCNATPTDVRRRSGFVAKKNSANGDSMVISWDVYNGDTIQIRYFGGTHIQSDKDLNRSKSITTDLSSGKSMCRQLYNYVVISIFLWSVYHHPLYPGCWEQPWLTCVNWVITQPQWIVKLNKGPLLMIW